MVDKGQAVQGPSLRSTCKVRFPCFQCAGWAQIMLYLAVYSMVHPDSFLKEEDILADKDVEVGEVEGQGPSPS